MEEYIVDPLDSPEPYVSPDIIGETVIKDQTAAVTEKSKPR